MAPLKWETVKPALISSDDKVLYLQELIKEYQQNSKYYSMVTYICKEVIKHIYKLYTEAKNPALITQIPEWIAVVKLILSLLRDDSIISFVAKCSPHLIVTVGKQGKLEDVYSLAVVLQPAVSTSPLNTANLHIFDGLLKAASQVTPNSVKKRTLKANLQVIAMEYYLKCPTDRISENISTTCAGHVKNLTSEDKAVLIKRYWNIYNICLDRDIGVVKLSELLFSLIVEGVGVTTSALAKDALTQYKAKLSNSALKDVFSLSSDILEVFYKSVEFPDSVLHFNNTDIPSEVIAIFGSSNKNDVWILLSVARCLSTVFQASISVSFPCQFVPLISQVVKLLLRSPQITDNRDGVKLLHHVTLQLQLHQSLKPEDLFHQYVTSILTLYVHACNKGLLSDKTQVRSYLEVVSGIIPNFHHRIQCLELGMDLGDVPDIYAINIATMLRSKGYINDAIQLLTGSSADTKLQLALCHITKLDFNTALPILSGVEKEELLEVQRSTCRILLTYCQLLSSYKDNSPFSLPPPANFCEDADNILKNGVVDDVVSTITMFLGGLYGLHSINISFSKLLSTANPNHVISLLAAVPSYVAMATEFHDHESDIGTLISSDSSIGDIQKIVDKNNTESEEDVLYRGVGSFVLIDKLLAENYSVYDAVQDSLAASLQAAMTQLKSSKQTKMSTKALVWKTCCLIPYMLRVMERYINFLYYWGSAHHAFSYLDRFYQVAKFVRSEYWLSRHMTLVNVLKLTLYHPTQFTPTNLVNASCHGNEFYQEYITLATCTRDQQLLLSQEQNMRSGDESCDYLIANQNVSSQHFLDILIMGLHLRWHELTPGPGVLSEYFEALTTCCKTGYVAAETRILSEAWLSLLSYYNKPQVSPGRRRRVRNTSRRTRAVKTLLTDYITEGIKQCKSLHPVIVKRALLQLKLKEAADFDDIDEMNRLPLLHQVHVLMTSHAPDTHSISDMPSYWTVVSLSKLENTLIIGRRTADSTTVRKREIPDTCMEEMRRIIEGNDDSIHHTNNKEQFWKTRYQLDNNLNSLLERLENEWLGPYRGVLFGLPTDEGYLKELTKNTTYLLKRIKKKVELDADTARYILDHYSILSEDDIMELIPESDDTVLSLIHELAPANPCLSRHPVLLTLDKGTDTLPWEACYSYKQQSITRIPSLHFALSVLAIRSLPVRVDQSDTFYILNPTNNLPATQSLFEPWLSQQCWKGVAAKPPTVTEYETALTSDVFLFLGHGSGKEFLKGRSIQDFDSKAVALLMGCNSGRIKHSPLGGMGVPFEYLLSGCPAVLGYLWNITDRDCDRFTKRLLELWVSKGEEVSLLSLMNISREACKLKHLVGAAPIHYGLPNIFSSDTSS